MKAISIYEHGGPEVLQYGEVSMPEPGAGEVRVKVEAAGVNFIDTYQRSGQYKVALPLILGKEGGGTVEALGEGVTAFTVGERVVFAMSTGTYAEYAVVPAWQLMRVPLGVSMELATAVILQGMTAHYLSHSTFPIQAGHTVLIHAAAGGTGSLLVQMARQRGARVIATTSTQEKAAVVRQNGADEVILYTQTDFEEAVQTLTGGQGVHAVYDGVGQATFLKGLNCLQPRGYMVLYGQASGAVAPIDPQILNRKGSLFLTRPSLAHYTTDPAEMQERADDLFNWIAAGTLQVRIDKSFLLDEAAAAHRYIEGRQTKGKILLMPPQIS